jgi:hypothetical protein
MVTAEVGKAHQQYMGPSVLVSGNPDQAGEIVATAGTVEAILGTDQAAVLRS